MVLFVSEEEEDDEEEEEYAFALVGDEDECKLLFCAFSGVGGGVSKRLYPLKKSGHSG